MASASACSGYLIVTLGVTSQQSDRAMQQPLIGPDLRYQLLLMLILISIGQLAGAEFKLSTEPRSVKITEFKVLEFDDSVISEITPIGKGDPGYNIKLIRNLSAIFVDVVAGRVNSRRSLYKLSDLNVCEFVKRRQVSRLLTNFFDEFSGHRTKQVNCPMSAGNYYFNSQFNGKIMPPIHPVGNFQLRVRVKSAAKEARSVFHFAWLYEVAPRKN